MICISSEYIVGQTMDWNRVEPILNRHQGCTKYYDIKIKTIHVAPHYQTYFHSKLFKWSILIEFLFLWDQVNYLNPHYKLNNRGVF